MGEVDLVHDSVRDEDVARKRVLTASPAALLRMKREFRAIEALRHPNLVRLYELDEDEHGVFFTMEFVRGLPLVQALRGAPSSSVDPSRTVTLPSVDRAAPTRTAPRDASSLGAGTPPTRVTGSRHVDVERVRGVVAAIASALAFLHANGIVHRDLKPARARHYAAVALRSVPFATARAIRAMAYLAEIEGAPGRAIDELVASIQHAETHGQICELACGRYQLGRRLGGDEGRWLIELAQTTARRYGLDEHFLDEHLLFARP